MLTRISRVVRTGTLDNLVTTGLSTRPAQSLVPISDGRDETCAEASALSERICTQFNLPMQPPQCVMEGLARRDE